METTRTIVVPSTAALAIKVWTGKDFVFKVCPVNLLWPRIAASAREIWHAMKIRVVLARSVCPWINSFVLTSRLPVVRTGRFRLNHVKKILTVIGNIACLVRTVVFVGYCGD